jgi:hypothetical protein
MTPDRRETWALPPGAILSDNPEARYGQAQTTERSMIPRRTFIKGASMLALAASTSRMSVRESVAHCHHHIYDVVRFPPATPGGRIIHSPAALT